MPNPISNDVFEVIPASISDIEEITQIFCISLLKDRLSIALNSQISYEEHFAHVRDVVQGPKFANPLYIWFKAVDKQSSKMVGWACMRLVGKNPPSVPDHQNSTHTPEGLNQRVLQYLLNELGVSMLESEGYDQEKHLLRSGLHVHPDFQRRGIASQLSKKLEAIADQEERVTFARARPVAASFFESEGWRRIGERTIPYRELGVDLDSDCLVALRRDPVKR